MNFKQVLDALEANDHLFGTRITEVIGELELDDAHAKLTHYEIWLKALRYMRTWPDSKN